MYSNSDGTTADFLKKFIFYFLSKLLSYYPFFFLKWSISRQDELDWGAADVLRSAKL